MNKRILIVLIALLSLGCTKNDDKMKVHSSSLTWAHPAGWIEETPSPMRKAQYRLPKADGDSEDVTVAVFYFPGQGGSVEANLDRWYGQFIQSDGRPTKETAKVVKNNVNGLQQTTVDVKGTYLESMRPMGGGATSKPNFRMLAGIVETTNGPWFVKLIGPTNSVEHWEESFETFMKSIKG